MAETYHYLSSMACLFYTETIPAINFIQNQIKKLPEQSTLTNNRLSRTNGIALLGTMQYCIKR